MKKNIFLEIEYLGTGYFGFQIQVHESRSEVTVQGLIEKAIEKLFKQKVRIVYAGRTDRGVHAKGQVVNFIVDTSIPLNNIKAALNTLLPLDIRIKRLKKVSLDFHARFWAKSKLYEYVILNRDEPSVFDKDFSWHVAEKLDLDKMKKAAKKLTGKKDFVVFAKEAKRYKTCVRKIKEIRFKKKGNFIHIYIEADGFLRSMVRNIMAFLVRVGLGKIKLSDVGGIIKGKLPYANKPAPGSGLYLVKVNYEEV